MLADKDVTRRIDKRKRIRFIGEGAFLLIVLAIIIDALFVFSTYKPYDDGDVATDKDRGFVALSYFGVDRTGTNDLIGVDLLDEHLAASIRTAMSPLLAKISKTTITAGKRFPNMRCSSILKMAAAIPSSLRKNCWKNIIITQPFRRMPII